MSEMIKNLEIKEIGELKQMFFSSECFLFSFCGKLSFDKL